MNNSIFTFKLDDTIKITLETGEYPKDYPYCLYKDRFFLHQNHKKIQISYFLTASNIEKLIITLKKCLNNDKELFNNIEQNIGYAWNIYINAENDSQLEYANKKYEYLNDDYLWYSTYATWIYNDTKNNIILEVTPTYPHTYDESFSYQDFLTWMQNYKPLLKTKIPRNVAKQWLMQAQQILDTIDENSQMLHEQGKL